MGGMSSGSMASAVSGATIKIVEPAAGQTVKAGLVKVKVTIDGAPPAVHAHWHMWLNGTLVGMVDGPETELALPVGDQTLAATLTEAGGHEDRADDPRSEVKLKVEP
jgi:hypothetical protein